MRVPHGRAGGGGGRGEEGGSSMWTLNYDVTLAADVSLQLSLSLQIQWPPVVHRLSLEPVREVRLKNTSKRIIVLPDLFPTLVLFLIYFAGVCNKCETVPAELRLPAPPGGCCCRRAQWAMHVTQYIFIPSRIKRSPSAQIFRRRSTIWSFYRALVLMRGKKTSPSQWRLRSRLTNNNKRRSTVTGLRHHVKRHRSRPLIVVPEGRAVTLCVCPSVGGPAMDTSLSPRPDGSLNGSVSDGEESRSEDSPVHTRLSWRVPPPETLAARRRAVVRHGDAQRDVMTRGV